MGSRLTGRSIGIGLVAVGLGAGIIGAAITDVGRADEIVDCSSKTSRAIGSGESKPMTTPTGAGIVGIVFAPTEGRMAVSICDTDGAHVRTETFVTTELVPSQRRLLLPDTTDVRLENGTVATVFATYPRVIDDVAFPAVEQQIRGGLVDISVRDGSSLVSYLAPSQSLAGLGARAAASTGTAISAPSDVLSVPAVGKE